MRYAFHFVQVALFALPAAVWSAPAATRPADEQGLKVEGHFTVAAPAEGFRWRKQPTGDANAKMEVFAAAKEGTPDAAVVLVAGKESADKDAKRIAQIKGEYNGTIVGLQKLGVTDLKGNPAPVKPPIGNKATFVLFGKDKQGKDLYERVVLVFGKWSYHFQIVARSEEQLDQLSKVADTLKEQ